MFLYGNTKGFLRGSESVFQLDEVYRLLLLRMPYSGDFESTSSRDNKHKQGQNQANNPSRAGLRQPTLSSTLRIRERKGDYFIISSEDSTLYGSPQEFKFSDYNTPLKDQRKDIY